MNFLIFLYSLDNILKMTHLHAKRTTMGFYSNHVSTISRGHTIVKCKEILRFYNKEINGRNIASCLKYSRNTLLAHLREIKSRVLHSHFHRSYPIINCKNYFSRQNLTIFMQQPNCEYIHKEMSKSEVTYILLSIRSRWLVGKDWRRNFSGCDIRSYNT